MENTAESPTITPAAPPTSQPVSADRRLAEISSWVGDLNDPPKPSPSPARSNPKTDRIWENRLIQVRLGVAGGLFAALRSKHGPTAEHSLRVAIATSAWAHASQLAPEERDEIEVAALLHDVGKIGVPDSVLLKPGKLTSDEQAYIERHRKFGVEILSHCAASPGVLSIVQFASAWFDGRKGDYQAVGRELPLGARMLAIVDAYDAMTTDQVYRRALSRERAVGELFEFAGAQFDPHLVRQFCAMLEGDGSHLQAAVARHWLTELNPQVSNELWRRSQPLIRSDQNETLLFHHQVIEALPDGVVFVDTGLRILMWNRALEQMSGIPAASVIQKQWTPPLIGLCNEKAVPINPQQCPLCAAIKNVGQDVVRLRMNDRHQNTFAVEAQTWPVLGEGGVVLGAALLVRDASSQITLEERVRFLRREATLDPLTQVSNRAEFDRTLVQFVDKHLQEGTPCSLIICDLDHFKSVNDTYGHQAGDDALVSFASLLRRNHRPGDLVARYGGEEFVMLCADCGNATAAKRAEVIRHQIEEEPQPKLSGRRITASFGVTEIQHGDTAETMLRRADRALLQAKEMGRNRVVQLGAGISDRENPPTSTSKGWLSWPFSRIGSNSAPDYLLSQDLITPVPVKMVVEKLRGFVADHEAEIVDGNENQIVLSIHTGLAGLARRHSDRVTPYLLELQLDQISVDEPTSRGAAGADRAGSRTLIRVVIRPKRNRDRRRRDAVENARRMLVSLKAYLMAQDHHQP